MGWEWINDALCAGSDVDFFSEDAVEIGRAKAICAQCPVRRECIQSALDNEDRFGVWGGADENEIRRALSINQYGRPTRRVRAARCPLCKSREVATLVTKRTNRHLQCQDCGLSWWGRVSSQVVKINTEDLDDDDNDEERLEDDLSAGSGDEE